MCELFAMSARYPTTVHLSLDELARHGGGTGPHRDGWGVAYHDGRDAFVIREPAAASESRWVDHLQGIDLRSTITLAHIRRATQGERLLRNTQPFTRELGGRVHVFAHNGMLPGIEDVAALRSERFLPIGDTDSEPAFLALLDRLAPLWSTGLPPLDARLDVIAAHAARLRALGPANFIYSDGDAIFAHGHRRRHDDGAIRAPGLHWLCRRCSATEDGVAIAGVRLPHEAEQEVALLASVPLSREPWTPLAEGEVVALREGRFVARRAP